MDFTTRTVKRQIEIAIDYIEAGVSIVPLKLDGSKRPAIVSWKEFQTRLPTSTEVESWFYGRVGMGVICGAVSGGLEVLDFDGEADSIFPAWYRTVEAIAARLPIVETPSGGVHVYWRCSTISGNQKIASDSTAAKETLIETRGEGGYVVGVASPDRVHSAGYPYVQVAGPVLPEIPAITRNERLALWKAARTFDRAELLRKEIAKATPKPVRVMPITGREPWKQFDSQADWGSMLRADGWSSFDGIHWTRPGKSSGTSATLREASGGDFVLVVFSSNAQLPPATYSASSYLAHSRFGGDFRQATRAILEGVR